MVTRASGIAALISASISPAAIAMPALPGSAVHPGRKEAFMRRAQCLYRYGAPIGQCQILSAGGTDTNRRQVSRFGGADEAGGVRDRDEVAALVLAEPVGVAWDIARSG